jgi:glycosyltransferase involved in cell wall biosynthesis
MTSDPNKTTRRIAYFEPVSGLNAYGRELLPYLRQYYDVDVFTGDRRERLVPDLVGAFPLYHYDDFRGRDDYVQLIFQLRNNPAHSPVYDLLLTYGGVSVFHDVNISGIIGGKTLGHGRPWAFLNQLRLIEGLGAFVLSSLNILLRKQWPDPDQYMMNKAACRRSRGIIVHNRQAHRALTKVVPQMPITIVRRGVPETDKVDPIAARHRLGLPREAFLIVSLGVVAEKKRVPQALAAFARLRDQVPNARYILVGRPASRFDIEGLIRHMELSEQVQVTGWIAEDTFYDYLSAADVCVHLRYPVEGETSSVALRSMSYAKPTLVSDAGSMREWPDDVCIKIKPDDGEVEAIYQALYNLFQDVNVRRTLGERACAYTRRYHTWEAAARGYRDFLESLIVQS